LARKIILILLCYGPFVGLFAQIGCTDPQADNFDVSASINDGSCVYPATNHAPVFIQNLSSILLENSGMIYWNEYLWMVNDGGSLPCLFKLDQTGNIIDTFCITNANNVDWEALTQSDTRIYIGDFGNNPGNRTDLCIYEVNKADLLSGNNQILAQKRTFKYGDQTTYSHATNGHSFDCESFYFDNDSLVLLSKGWDNLYSKRYRFESEWNDTLTIFPQDSMFVDGLLTDVSLDSASKRVIALGYKNNGSNFYTSFVYLLFDYSDAAIFNGNKRRIELGNMLTLSQTEGIALKDSVSGFISAEQITSVITIPPKLFSFDFTNFFSGNSGINALVMDSDLTIYPNPSAHIIRVPSQWIGKMVQIQNLMGQYFGEIVVDTSYLLDLGNFPIGGYILTVDGKHYRITLSF
jgi:hypothetical protein